MKRESVRGSPGLLSVGGERRSLICASLSPSTHCTSSERSRGQLEVQSADTAAQEHPDNFNTRRPEKTRGSSLDAGHVKQKRQKTENQNSLCLPGNLLMSQLNCFLEMLVQLRSRETGCRRIIPLSMSGVMEVQRFRSIFVQSLLSQHLRAGEKNAFTESTSFTCKNKDLDNLFDFYVFTICSTFCRLSCTRTAPGA